MEDKVNYTLVGVFVLALGAALVAAVLWLAVGLDGKTKADPYASIIPESVAGLNVGAPVKYLGVDVGKVSQILIDPQNSRQVLLRFLIEHGTPIKQDSEAVLKTQGLTGIVYVELSGGSAGSPPLVATTENPVPLIASKPSLSSRLENVLGTVLASLDSLAVNVSRVFDAENSAALKQTLVDTAALAHALAAQRNALSAGIKDAARTARLAAQASVQLEPALARISSGAAAFEGMSKVAGDAGARAGLAADAAASGVQQIRSETLPEFGRLMAEINQLAVALQRLSEQTQRNPSSLLVGGPTRPAGPGERVTP